jgi:hypothetical protein
MALKNSMLNSEWVVCLLVCDNTEGSARLAAASVIAVRPRGEIDLARVLRCPEARPSNNLVVASDRAMPRNLVHIMRDFSFRTVPCIPRVGRMK